MNMLLNRISAAEAVVNYFKEQIEHGQLQPGDRLPSERLLQQELGISRFSLREGLARMSALGIIRIVHGKGAYIQSEISSRSLGDVLVPLVQGQNGKHLEDLFEARRLIEAEASKLAATRRTDAGLQRLRDILRQSESCLRDPSGFAELDFQFHRQIASMSGNVFVEKMLEVLNEQVRSFLQAHAKSTVSRERALKSHWQIFYCIETGDVDAAANLTVKHLSGCKSNFENNNKKGGSLNGEHA